MRRRTIVYFVRSDVSGHVQLHSFVLWSVCSDIGTCTVIRAVFSWCGNVIACMLWSVCSGSLRPCSRCGNVISNASKTVRRCSGGFVA